MRCLVTGGAGYIGSHLVRMLLNEGHRITIIDNLTTGNLWSVPQDPRVTFIYGDILNLKQLLSPQASFDVVFHLAASALVAESVQEPLKYQVNNVGGTINLLAFLATIGSPPVIFASSTAVYRNSSSPLIESCERQPANPYGHSKMICEDLLQYYGQRSRIVCLRLFNVAGAGFDIGEHHDPETHLIPNLLLAARDGYSVKLHSTPLPHSGDGTCVRDYVHVLDVARAFLIAADHFGSEKIQYFNIGNGIPISNLQLVKKCEEISGREITIQRFSARPGDPAALVANISSAKQVLSWSPKYDIDAIIKSAWDWHNNYPKHPKTA